MWLNTKCKCNFYLLIMLSYYYTIIKYMGFYNELNITFKKKCILDALIYGERRCIFDILYRILKKTCYEK